MRLWLSGSRLFNGLVRPGISLGKEDFRSARKAPAMVAEATLGLFRRPDGGAILMAIAHMNGDADTRYARLMGVYGQCLPRSFQRSQ
jgi:hypothetical protein